MLNRVVKPVNYSLSASREAIEHRREVVIDDVGNYTTSIELRQTLMAHSVIPLA
jgi:hypothetical protein